MRAGEVTDVAPGVRRVVAPNPSLMTGPGTNTYLVGHDALALVDPGPALDAHLEALLALVGDRLRWILVTHTHNDHAPLSARLKSATGAEILAFGAAPAGVTGGLDGHDQDFAPDRLLAAGERLDAGDFVVEAVHTPGHTSNHLCFELDRTGLLFSGDHVMSGSTVVIAPPDGDMIRYLESLELIRRRRPARIAPGHGPMIDDPASVLDEYLRHRHEREHQVLAGLGSPGDPAGGVTAADLVARIYVAIPDKLRPVARYSVWAHLRKLAAEGRAWSPELDDIDAPWHRLAPAP